VVELERYKSKRSHTPCGIEDPRKVVYSANSCYPEAGGYAKTQFTELQNHMVALPMTKNNTTKPKRRWLSFSLRTLLVFMCVVGVMFGLWARSAKRQREVVEWVEKNGGKARFVPSWICFAVPRRWIYSNRDYLMTVTHVSLPWQLPPDLTPLRSLDSLSSVGVLKDEDVEKVRRKLADMSLNCSVYGPPPRPPITPLNQNGDGLGSHYEP